MLVACSAIDAVEEGVEPPSDLGFEVRGTR
jgi:hypothetical protein